MTKHVYRRSLLVTEVILTDVPTKGGNYASVYYFEGNIFQPLFYATKRIERAVEQKIRIWLYQNREKVKADRQKPGYRTLTQLARVA